MSAPQTAVSRNTQSTPGPAFHISEHDRGIIEIAFIGAQTEQTVNAALAAVQPRLDEFQQRGQAINLLIDNEQMTRSNIAANQRVRRAIKELPFHKMAGVNANPVVRLVVNAIIATAGVGRRVKLFQDRSLAETWLLKP